MNTYQLDFYEVDHGGSFFQYPNNWFRVEIVQAESLDDLDRIILQAEYTDRYKHVFTKSKYMNIFPDARYTTPNSSIRVKLKLDR